MKRRAMLLLVLLAGVAWGDETVNTNIDRMAWWRDAKFGLFVHWGLYAAPAGEWQGRGVDGYSEWLMQKARIPVRDYEALAGLFNPTGFDARAWVRTAKNAGMKYVVFTAKHHDGFAMFGSRASSYNIVDATPFRRDPLKELADACRTEGLPLGVYYSQRLDWHEQDGAGNDWDFSGDRDFNRYLHAKAIPQLKELLSNYGPLGVVWFDMPTGMTGEQADELRALVRSMQPACLLNDRGGPGGGDFETPEQMIPGTADARPWEACMTMNNSWGFKVSDHDWKSATSLICNLIDIASKGGNYLLNVGPTADGVFPAECVERLEEIGRWMKSNGEAVYGTSMSPFTGTPAWVRFTRKGDRIYALCFAWPEDHMLRIPGGAGRVATARLLTDPTPLEVTQDGADAMVRLPGTAPDPHASVVALDCPGASW